MSIRNSLLALAGLATFAACGVAVGQNTTPGAAAGLPVEADWARSFYNTTFPERWYYVGLIPGRSYCVSTSVDETTVDTPSNDTTIAVFTDQGTTLYTSNDDNFNEPVSGLYARDCFIWTPANNSLTGWIRIRPFGGATATTRFFRFKVYDTALTAPWWYVQTGTGYNAFIEIANTTNSTVQVRVQLRSSAGATIGSAQTFNIGPYGNTGVSAQGFGVTAGSGSVQISHDGAPGAIIANVTSLSAVEGLSFDSPATRRQSW